MVRVDVGSLDRDEGLHVLGRRSQALSQQLGHDLDQLRVQTRVPLELLSSGQRQTGREEERTALVQLWQIFMSSS